MISRHTCWITWIIIIWALRLHAQELNYIVEIPHDSQGEFSVRNDNFTTIEWPAEGVHRQLEMESDDHQGYSSWASPYDDDDQPPKRPGYQSLQTTIIERVTSSLIYSTPTVVGYYLKVFLSDDSSLNGFSSHWIPVLGAAAVFMQTITHWHDDVPLFVQMEEQESNAYHQMQIINYGRGNNELPPAKKARVGSDGGSSGRHYRGALRRKTYPSRTTKRNRDNQPPDKRCHTRSDERCTLCNDKPCKERPHIRDDFLCHDKSPEPPGHSIGACHQTSDDEIQCAGEGFGKVVSIPNHGPDATSDEDTDDDEELSEMSPSGHSESPDPEFSQQLSEESSIALSDSSSECQTEPGKSKKPGVRFTEDQLRTLQKAFKKNPRQPDHVRAEKLANQTGLTVKTVKKHFANKRGRLKKTNYRLWKKTRIQVHTRITTAQRSSLQKAFKQNPRQPNDVRVKKLADETGLTVKTVKKYFATGRGYLKNTDYNLWKDTQIKAQTRITTAQANTLQKAFQQNPRVPDAARAKKLADETGLTVKKVKKYFDQKRTRLKETDHKLWKKTLTYTLTTEPSVLLGRGL